MAVRVKVHDNQRALRSAAAKHAKSPWGSKHDVDTDYSGVAGICHRFHIMNNPLVAIVRLAPPYLGAGILSHEMLHAAIWMWEIENKFSRKIPLTCVNDEWICWVLGELVNSANATMYELGVYESA